MPRLTDADYYKRYHFLNHVWRNYEGLFAEVSPSEQHAIHNYYAPAGDFSKDDLLFHRYEITAAEPSLPARASRAYLRLHQLYASRVADMNKKYVKQMEAERFRPRKPRGKVTGVSVKGIVRSEIDWDRYAWALLQHTRIQMEGERDES